MNNKPQVDPVTFAVIKNAFDAIVDEMAYTVMRTARSPIVRDVLDYSCTLCAADGAILTQAKTVALHLGAVPDAIEAVLKAYQDDIQPGDVIILNDPYEGGMHLPDIFMFKPIFYQDKLQGFAVVVAHQCDMGGRVPGSNASDSTEIFQEGLRIPPLKLYEAGKANKQLHRIIEKNVRLPEMVIGDIESQLATCVIGEREYIKLLQHYNEETLALYVDELLDYAERLTRAAIKEWPDGEYTFTDYIDDDGFDDKPIPIKVTIKVADDHLCIDYSGSSAQVKGAINSTFSYTKSSSYLSVRCVLGREVPNNSGVYRCMTIFAPSGSILNPELPAPVAARALTGYRVLDTMMGCLAQIVPERVTAAGEGGNTVVCLGGYDKDTRTPFVMVDMINGAWGARANKDGIEGVTNPSQNMSNMPVETLEQRYPVRIESFAYRENSCGAGRYRGGLGLVREYRLLAESATLQLRADRVKHRPYGLFGGKPAQGSVNILNPGNEQEILPGKVTMTLTKDAVIRHEQAGGGGYGDPFQRDPAAVAEDVRNGKISCEHAGEHYGVVLHLHPADFTLDLQASADLRAKRL